MNIIIGFSKPKDHIFPIFSWLIRAFDKTKYSHVYIRWRSSGLGVDVVYHAAGSMVHFLSKREFDKTIEPVEEYELQAPKHSYRTLVKYCMENAGVSYGAKQVAGLAIQRIFRLKRNPFSDGKSTQVCNELVGNILEDVFGIEVGLHLDSASPKDINKLMKKLKLKRIK